MCVSSGKLTDISDILTHQPPLRGEVGIWSAVACEAIFFFFFFFDTARVRFIRAEGPRGHERLRHPLPLPTPHLRNVHQPQL